MYANPFMLTRHGPCELPSTSGTMPDQPRVEQWLAAQTSQDRALTVSDSIPLLSCTIPTGADVEVGYGQSGLRPPRASSQCSSYARSLDPWQSEVFHDNSRGAMPWREGSSKRSFAAMSASRASALDHVVTNVSSGFSGQYAAPVDLPVGTRHADQLMAQFCIHKNVDGGWGLPGDPARSWSQSYSSRDSAESEEALCDSDPSHQAPSPHSKLRPPKGSVPTVNIHTFTFSSPRISHLEGTSKMSRGWHWGNGCHDENCIAHYIGPRTSKHDIGRALSAMKTDTNASAECVETMKKKWERKKEDVGS